MALRSLGLAARVPCKLRLHFPAVCAVSCYVMLWWGALC